MKLFFKVVDGQLVASGRLGRKYRITETPDGCLVDNRSNNMDFGAPKKPFPSLNAAQNWCRTIEAGSKDKIPKKK